MFRIIFDALQHYYDNRHNSEIWRNKLSCSASPSPLCSRHDCIDHLDDSVQSRVCADCHVSPTEVIINGANHPHNVKGRILLNGVSFDQACKDQKVQWTRAASVFYSVFLKSFTQAALTTCCQNMTGLTALETAEFREKSKQFLPVKTHLQYKPFQIWTTNTCVLFRCKWW